MTATIEVYAVDLLLQKRRDSREEKLAEFIKNANYSPRARHIDDKFGVRYLIPPVTGKVFIHLTDGGVCTLSENTALTLLDMNVAHKFEPPIPAFKGKIWREIIKKGLMQPHPMTPDIAILTEYGCVVLGHFVSMLEHEHNGRKA